MATGSTLLLRWYERTASGYGYAFCVLFWYVVTFLSLMFTPYFYDQANKTIYEAALASNDLVIREFSTAFQNTIIDDCSLNSAAGAGCNVSELFDELSGKKIIALDYVDKLKSAQQLDFGLFIRLTLIVFGFGLALTAIVAFAISHRTVRFLLLTLIYFSTFPIIHWMIDLPHKNIKFYYTVGSVFAILLPLMDFFHRVPISLGSSTSPSSRLAGLEGAHKRWSTILSVALAIVITLVGTVLFNIIDYQTSVFGESFIFFPLLGFVFELLIALLAFFLGRTKEPTHNSEGN